MGIGMRLEPSGAKYIYLYYTGGLKAQAERFHSKRNFFGLGFYNYGSKSYLKNVIL